MINDNIEDKLDRLLWNRSEGHFKLRSVIQYNQNSLSVGGRTIKTALAIHEHVESHFRVNEEDDGTYSLVPEKRKATNWAHLHITPSYIVVDKKNSRAFVRDIISKGLKLPVNTPSFLALDTKKIAGDHKNHWTRAFAERIGRVNEGVVYGDAVEQDAEIGPVLASAKVNTVGITTNYFGNPLKVRVSSNGVITLLGKNTYEEFIDYLESEIMSYMMKIPL
jgi:hypothetical protein